MTWKKAKTNVNQNHPFYHYELMIKISKLASIVVCVSPPKSPYFVCLSVCLSVCPPSQITISPVRVYPLQRASESRKWLGQSPKPPAGTRIRGAQHPNILVRQNWPSFWSSPPHPLVCASIVFYVLPHLISSDVLYCHSLGQPNATLEWY